MESKVKQYRAKRILFGQHWLEDGVISISDKGFILDITSFDSTCHQLAESLGDVSLLPGLIDTHVHGACGCDVMDASHESLNTMSEYMVSKGVTGFVATTVTASEDKIHAALVQIADSQQQGLLGAELLGGFLEGPYLTAEHRGAHEQAFLRDISLSELEAFIKVSRNTLTTVALAPEKLGADEAIHYLKQQGLRVMLGHTNASYDCVCSALDAGADGIVHCYNGMRGLHHREPGVVGAGLLHPHSYVEMIADGHHVHPAAIELADRCCGDRMMLITDAMRAANMPDGEYLLGEAVVHVSDGIARTQSGGLAGSTLNLLKAVMNTAEWLTLPFEKVWARASLTPAKFLRQDHRLGSLEQGKSASMVALNPDLSISKTWVNGKLVFAS